MSIDISPQLSDNVLTPIFPEWQMHNFAIGIPTNERRVYIDSKVWGTCLVDTDYTRVDETAPVLFPQGFHVRAGGPGLAGGFHQGLPFSPDKVRVVPYTNRRGETKNVIRLMGKQSLGDTSGTGVCARFIEPNFLWQSQAQFEYRVKVVFPATGLGVYWNCELRGNPTFMGRNEKTELVGVHFMSNHIMMKWWPINQHDNANASEQIIYKLEHTLLRDAVYTIAILLTCTKRPNEWQAQVTVSVHGDIIWNVVTDETNSPGSHSSIGMDVFGVERGGIVSGTAYVLLAAPRVYIPKSLAQDVPSA